MKFPANRLRVVRAEKRVTQEALELKTKRRITQTNVSLIENGYRDATPRERRIIARALGVTVQDVFPEAEAVAR